MNARLHVGHAYEMVLADIFARYHRDRGEKTFFLTGADEHGDKIIASAQKEGLGPKAFVDKNIESFQELLEKLSVTNDAFIRTSDQETHWPGAQKLWSELEKAGDIYKGIYEGLYCVGCEGFKTEKELVEGKCPLHDKEPDQIKEENYFFKLSKYTADITRLLETKELEILPSSKSHEMLALLAQSTSEGSGDVSISRPVRAIPWGIPVPGDSSQLMYVWCDALSNYISALGYGSGDDSKFSEFWPADVQIIGKDIARFHSILWPAFLLSTKIPTPKKLFIHGFINSGGKKMSKSIGNTLSAEEFISEYGSDALRYYFAREISPFEDGDLTREKFKEVYNANLANGLGNLVSRTLKMAEQYFAGRISGSALVAPPIRTRIAIVSDLGDLQGLNIPYLVTNDILPRYHAHMEKYEVNKAADVIWELIGHLDQHIADYQPFKLVKTDPQGAENVLWGVVYGLNEILAMVAPILPTTASKMRLLLGAPGAGEKEGEAVYMVKAPTEPLFMRKD